MYVDHSLLIILISFPPSKCPLPQKSPPPFLSFVHMPYSIYLDFCMVGGVYLSKGSYTIETPLPPAATNCV